MKENYIKAFDRMLKVRKAKGKDDSTGQWKDSEAVYRWWVEDDTIPGQLKFNLEGEIEGG
jgi:putative phosphoadenosine phosphosulfate reductase